MNERQSKRPNLWRVAAKLAAYGDSAMPIACMAMSALASADFCKKEDDAA